MYFANPSTAAIRGAMNAGLLGMIATPAQGNAIPDSAAWCSDNGCFGDGYPGDGGYLAFLADRAGQGARCVFAVAPDVPFDMAASLKRSRPMLARIRTLGYPVALAAQNGSECMALPWDDFDVLFLGGDTGWKVGAHARRLTAGARARGKRVHMGRVNSLRRLRYADAIGCDSADGTFLAFGPDRNLPELLGWLRDVNDQGALWSALLPAGRLVEHRSRANPGDAFRAARPEPVMSLPECRRAGRTGIHPDPLMRADLVDNQLVAALMLAAAERRAGALSLARAALAVTLPGVERIVWRAVRRLRVVVIAVASPRACHSLLPAERLVKHCRRAGMHYGPDVDVNLSHRRG